MQFVEAAGARIPALGFGTWRLSGDTCRSMVGRAFEIGYRHIDTAQMYDNEAEVGAALRASDLPREEVFLTTKISPDDFAKDRFKDSLRQRLDLLRQDHVDLLLLHWPNRTVPIQETMEAMNEAVADGHTRHIGVSNFTVPMVEAAQTVSQAQLATNQVEYHPYLAQDTLLTWMRAKYISLTAYCPLARGKVADDPLLQKIGEAHGKTPSQVALRWLVQQPEVIAIPRTSNPARAKENFEVFDFILSEDEMTAIKALGTKEGRLVQMSNVAPDEWD